MLILSPPECIESSSTSEDVGELAGNDLVNTLPREKTDRCHSFIWENLLTVPYRRLPRDSIPDNLTYVIDCLEFPGRSLQFYAWAFRTCTLQFFPTSPILPLKWTFHETCMESVIRQSRAVGSYPTLPTQWAIWHFTVNLTNPSSVTNLREANHEKTISELPYLTAVREWLKKPNPECLPCSLSGSEKTSTVFGNHCQECWIANLRMDWIESLTRLPSTSLFDDSGISSSLVRTGC